jgi:predicted HTH transcriptional regulator
MADPSELLKRMRNFEDNYIERKTFGDKKKDWLKTVVAFSNTVPLGETGVLFIGAKNDGTVEDQNVNLDTLQKTFNEEIAKVYPPVSCQMQILEDGAKQCLAILIPGSKDRPHFAGPAFIRKGSETIVASESLFNQLIAERQSKPYTILRWKGKQIDIDVMYTGDLVMRMGPVQTSFPATVVDCTLFYVSIISQTGPKSIPLDRINVSHSASRLKLEVIGHL